MNGDARRSHFAQARHHHKLVIEPGGSEITDGQIGQDIHTFARVERGTLIDPGDRQHVGAGTLHEAQIVGVIDNARQVSVLEEDAHRKAVLPPGKSPALRKVVRRHVAAIACGTQ